MAVLVIADHDGASLPNIMKAKKKEIAMKAVADYGVDVAPRLKVLKVTEPPKRQAAVTVLWVVSRTVAPS